MDERITTNFKDDVSIVLCGEAGQGIQTVEHILTNVLKRSGYNVFSTQEYMSRIRGGNNSTSIRVSSKKVSAPVDRVDILIPFNKGALNHVGRRLNSSTIVIGERKLYGDEYQGDNFIDLPLTDIATQIGGRIYLNTIAAAILSSLFKVDIEIFNGFLRQRFGSKDESIVQKNIQAAEQGYKLGNELSIDVDISRSEHLKDEIIIDGIEALSMGAIAGGCNFLAFYPMSPSTGVAVFLAQHAKEFGVIVEQAEDEISAMNMALGAWYAGGRGLASTSGGGFALMVEALSLAGMIESPVVIHLAERPGPATGMPTRTEQADLFFALFAGHGEFPRIILAPGTTEDAFYLTQRAFNLADKYQVPVFILTDQFILESHYNIKPLDPTLIKKEVYIVETDENYKRYRLTDNGVSPRGIPGYGKGLVILDSDEHDEDGHITEDHDMRVKMVNKRLKKLELIKQEIIAPELYGNNDYRFLVVAWGSNYNVVKEAITNIDNDSIAMLHYKQVYPLHPETLSYLQKAEKVIIVENNATRQFGNLIRMCTGFDIQHKILKYNGLPFSVEEVTEGIRSIIKNGAD